jgi:hypothetical protein
LVHKGFLSPIHKCEYRKLREQTASAHRGIPGMVPTTDAHAHTWIHTSMSMAHGIHSTYAIPYYYYIHGTTYTSYYICTIHIHIYHYTV